jgi:hypothetical protein
MTFTEALEPSLWRTTAYIMVSISAIVFLIQRTSWAMFDPVFEVCIFHLPALAGATIYYLIQRRGVPQPKSGK